MFEMSLWSGFIVENVSIIEIGYGYFEGGSNA